MILTDPTQHTAYRKLVNRGFTPEASPRSSRGCARSRVPRSTPSPAAVRATSCRTSRRCFRCRRSASCSGCPTTSGCSSSIGRTRSPRPTVANCTPCAARSLAARSAGVRLRGGARRAQADEPGGRPHQPNLCSARSRSPTGRAPPVGVRVRDVHAPADLRRQRDHTLRGIGAMLAFNEYPEQWTRLIDDRRLIPTAVEEILRYVSPVGHMRRTVTRDIESRAARSGRANGW